MSDTTADVTGSEPVGEAVIEGVVDQGAGQSNDSGGNPNWQPFLDVLPTSLHGTVTPVLQEWDKGVTQRFQQIHEEYAPYKNYEQIVKAGVDPAAIEYALGIYQQLNEDPRAIYDALQEAFADQWGLNTPPVADPNQYQPQFGEEGYVDPRVDQLEAGFKQLAEVILSERQQIAEQNAFQEADSALDAELNGLKQQFGDFNERVVLGLMLGGLSGPQAVQEYQSTVNSALEASRRPPAPGIISQGGVVAPSQDVRKLDSKDTRALVADTLRRAQQS